jgi:transcriptional regulator with XRE-family HTH domain
MPKQPHKAEYERLGRALRQLRHTAGLTQEQAGEHVGARGQFVSEAERGARGLSWHRLLGLLDAYGATLYDLARAVEGQRPRASSKRRAR